MGSSISKENMIPLGREGNEEHDRLVREKLKGSSSPKRKFAQSLRRLRENPNKTSEEVYELISNPSASASEIVEMIKTAGEMELTPSEYIQLIRTAIEKHKAIFGNKVELNANFNVDIVKKEYNYREMALRFFQIKVFKDAKSEWTLKYGKEQAEEMYNQIWLKHEEAVKHLPELVRIIKKHKESCGFPPERYDVKLGYSEDEYSDFEKEIKEKEIEDGKGGESR